MKFWSNVISAIATAAASLLLAELALQFVNYPRYPLVSWAWDESPYRSDEFKSDQVNQLKLRGKPIRYAEKDFVVVLLGDSQVEAGIQGQKVQPERILENLLAQYGIGGAKVFSIASAGWGLDQQLIALRQYFRSYRADAVVHMLTTGNDFWETGNIERSMTSVPGRLKPTFKLDERGQPVLHAPPVFDWKLRHLLALSASRFRDAHPGDASIALRDWRQHLPPADRVVAAPGECPQREVGIAGTSPEQAARPEASDYTLSTDDDIDEARSPFSAALLPLSPRDAYFVKLTHTLQAEIEAEARSRKAQYVPVSWVRPSHEAPGLPVARCVYSATTGKTYPADFSIFRKLARNPRIQSPLLEPFLENEAFSLHGIGDGHLNVMGNFSVLNSVAHALAGARAPRPVPRIDAREAAGRSGLITAVPDDTGPILGTAAQDGGIAFSGFHARDADGRWSAGKSALMLIAKSGAPAGAPARQLRLLIEGHALAEGDLRLVWNGRELRRQSLTAASKHKGICADLVLEPQDQGLVVMEIISERTVRPSDLGIAGIDRELGYYVRRLWIRTRPTEPCPS